MNKIFLFLTATLLWFTASIPVSEAHEYSASYTTVTVDQEALLVTFSIDDLSVLEHIDADQNQTNQIEEEELQLVQDSVVEWYNQNVILTINDVAQRGMLESILLEEKNDKTYVTISQSYPTTDSLITLQDSLYLDSSWKTTYTNFVSILQGEDFTETILKGENRTASIDASTLGEASSTANASWLEFFILGMEHIITGYDHLLFLFALLLARQKVKDLIGIVTAFTIAHSITLTLGYLQVITLPSLLVEAVIALSICYVAIENLVRKEVKQRWALTFAFGLIHGLGFAGLLSEMTIPKDHLLVSLLSFNLGIEVVQILLVVLIIPVLRLVQQKDFYSVALKVASSFIVVVGAYWAFERLFL